MTGYSTTSQEKLTTKTDNRITSFFSVIHTSKFFSYIYLTSRHFFTSLTIMNSLPCGFFKRFQNTFPPLSNSYGLSPVCSLVHSVSRNSLSPLFACVKCCKTVASSLQAEVHIAFHTPDTRLARAAFFSAAHWVFQVDHLRNMYCTSCAD